MAPPTDDKDSGGEPQKTSITPNITWPIDDDDIDDL